MHQVAIVEHAEMLRERRQLQVLSMDPSCAAPCWAQLREMHGQLCTPQAAPWDKTLHLWWAKHVLQQCERRAMHSAM